MKIHSVIIDPSHVVHRWVWDFELVFFDRKTRFIVGQWMNYWWWLSIPLWLFIISKVPETIDTLFIVLRRQQLIFLHWFHHASVLVYCFYSYGHFAPSGRWFTSMNLCVHTIMYGYFALRAARFQVPRWIQQSITFLQLVQMAIGCIVNIAAYKYKQEGHHCMTSYNNIFVSLLLYLAYLLLFAYFFYSTYVRKNVKERTE
ncbi:unnamed protein product [Adineta ricciae]|uniref:Elongation of very long chain fatty acids protein n=1 Tax=Adineta ricciae TaxID=249248 RepID=A0A813YQD5_ADIRI|nr:unnamed protein product [Adineta ricciae]